MRPTIDSERLIALTDGVVAVIITIMVLELKPPLGADFASLRELAPTFLSFALSFVYVAIYWNNHHHFFRLVPHADSVRHRLDGGAWRRIRAGCSLWCGAAALRGELENYASGDRSCAGPHLSSSHRHSQRP